MLPDGALHLSLAQCFTQEAFSPISPGKWMVWSPVLPGESGWSQPVSGQNEEIASFLH